MKDVKCPDCGCQFDSSENPASVSENPATESETGETEESGEIELKLPEEKPIKTSWFGKRFDKG